MDEAKQERVWGGRRELNKPGWTDGMEGLMAGGKVREATRNKRGSGGKGKERRGGTIGGIEGQGKGQRAKKIWSSQGMYYTFWNIAFPWLLLWIWCGKTKLWICHGRSPNKCSWGCGRFVRHVFMLSLHCFIDRPGGGWTISKKKHINEVKSQGRSADGGLEEWTSIVQLSCAMPD